MKSAQVHLVVLCCAFSSASVAEEVSGIDTLMDLCIPIAATGESARQGLRDAGWVELNKPEAAAPMANLIASQMWHLATAEMPQQRLEMTKEYTDAYYASLGNEMLGQIFTLGDQVAMVLAADEDISCMWAGPEDASLLARVEAIGGFPAVDGTVTGAKTQTVEYGNSEYTRIETYAYIDSADRVGPLPYAARLDRSPAQ